MNPISYKNSLFSKSIAPILSLCIGLLMIVAINACTTDNEDEKVLEAAQQYALRSTDVAVNVQVESVVDDYARVKVIPKNPSAADEAIMYLKKENDTWKGIVIGTSFSPEDYQELKIPEKIR